MVRHELPVVERRSRRTFVVEAVDTVNARAFVVPAQDEKVLGVLDLVREQQAYRLQTLLAAVDIISEEQVVGFWREAAVFEQTQ